MTRRPGRSPARDQRGSATVLVVAVAGAVLLFGAGLGVVVAMVVAHRVAQSGADLAALAGAQAAGRGADACGAAGEVAVANGVRLTGCRAQGRIVEVTVSAPGPRWLGQDADLTAGSRAGPDS
jgi:secretion/DNA translocation related TadE-like protein